MTDHASSETPSKPEGGTVLITRTVARPVKTVWDVLMTTQGAETLLGPGAFFGEKGHTWESSNGRSGVIRSFHPCEQIRFSIRSHDKAPWSMAQLSLAPHDDATDLSIEFTSLPDDKDLDDFTQRWSEALNNIVELIQAS